MKNWILILTLGTLISIPFIGFTDTDSSTDSVRGLTTECSNSDGECTGRVFYDSEGFEGFVSCDCYANVEGEGSGIEADLGGDFGTNMDQSVLDQACESTLAQCPSSDSDGSCSFSNISISKNTSILSLLFL